MTLPSYIADIKQIIISARNKAHTAIYSAMIEAYWLIGRRIVEEEQNGKQRAEYGKEVIKTLSEELQNEFGKGFADRCLREYRQFYQNFMDFEFGTQCVPNLTWSHYRLIIRLSDKNAVKYYLTEASENNLSVRTLIPFLYAFQCQLHLFSYYGSFCLLEKSILSRKGGTAKEKSV